MRHRSNSRRSSLFCGAKIQSSRRPENRCRRRYAAGSQLRRMRLSGLSGPGRRAGQKRRYFVALLHGRRSRHDAKNRRVSGQSRCRTGTDGRRGALQRLVRHTNVYNGAPSCAVEAALYGGETGCAYGCLGNGDCVAACQFGAIVVNPETGLPEVDETKCTACGACVKACPRNIIELRKKGVKGRRIYVGCVNRDKGAVSRKVCAVSCIGCGKCVRTCPFEAITLENNLAYIDAEKCRLCRKCVAECPTGGIREINFPPRKTAADNPTTQA